MYIKVLPITILLHIGALVFSHRSSSTSPRLVVDLTAETAAEDPINLDNFGLYGLELVPGSDSASNSGSGSSFNNTLENGN